MYKEKEASRKKAKEKERRANEKALKKQKSDEDKARKKQEAKDDREAKKAKKALEKEEKKKDKKPKKTKKSKAKSTKKKKKVSKPIEADVNGTLDQEEYELEKQKVEADQKFIEQAQADEDNESAKAKPHSNCFYSLIKEGSHEPLQPKANEDKWSLTPTII